MEIKGKRFLVIGGAGFIGSHVVSELLKHDVKEVIIYDNYARGKISNISEQMEDPRCSVFPDGGDVRDIDILDKAMQGIDGVFHLAAMWLLHCKDYPRTAFEVNIAGTFNVLEACVKNKVQRLIYSSSASVYGDAQEIPMTETHPFNNKNFYGATKIAGEAMCRSFYDRYNLQYVGLRYMNVYGPHQDQTAAYTGVIPIMLNKIDENQTPEINGDGSQAYDFITVKDAARCNVLAMKSDSTDEFYNVGTGVQTSIKELCEMILNLKKSNLKVKYKPYTSEDMRRMVQNRIGCTKKSSKDLGFNYELGLQDGLKDLIAWRESNSGPRK
jgi:UDP-glucose 4-epimerase